MNKKLPQALKWLRANGITKLIPWILYLDDKKSEFANTRFNIENFENREIYTFAFRQDCDDFAGFEVIKQEITDRVVVFHPSFSNKKEKGLIKNEYENLWEFIKQEVIPETQYWYSDDDIEDLSNNNE